MHKALKMRFYPTEEQIQQLNLSFGHSRWVYNKALELRSNTYREDKVSLSKIDLIKSITNWKKENPWLKDASIVILQQKVIDLDRGYQNFFKGLKTGRKVGFPKFKAKNTSDSVRYVKNGFSYSNGLIKLAKQKEPLNIVWSYDKPEKISSVTVSRNKANQYFISLLTDVEIEKHPPTNKTIGLDLGIKDHVSTSDGEKYNLPNLKKEEARIIKRQKTLSRKQKGSNNREKAKVKLAKAWVDLTNKRKDYLHKLSSTLVNENQVIGVEDLAVKNMLKNRKLSKSISKQSWFTFVEMLRYKSEWYGRELIKIDRYHPSSKTCFECKGVVDSLQLNIREWVCSCGAQLDRDTNAAKNIKAVGLMASAYGENTSGFETNSNLSSLVEVGTKSREALGISFL